MQLTAMMRRGVLAAILAAALSQAARGDGSVGRSPMWSDPKYTSLAPMDQLKKLADLVKAKSSPPDLDVLRQDAARRYLHAESKGKASDEMKVYQQLAAAAKEGGPLAGLKFEMRFDGPFVDFLYCSALLADPVWQTGDVKAKLDLLAEWEHNGLVMQNCTSSVAAWVILEHVSRKTAGLPLRERGLAKLTTLSDLATGDSFKGNYVDSPAASWIWCEALAEHLALMPEWPTMKPRERINYLEKLYSSVKMNMWSGLNEEYCAAREALRADPRFTAAADVAAKQNVAGRFSAEQKIRNFSQSRLVSMFAGGKEELDERSAKGDKIDDLAGTLGPITDAAVGLKKLRDLAMTHAISYADYQAISTQLALRYVLSGDPSKPALAAAELAKWKPLRDGDAKAVLKVLNTNMTGPLDLPALANVIVGDPAYTKATWVSRSLLVDKVQAAYPTWGSPLWETRQVMIRFAVASETAASTPAQRGEAELRVLQKMRPVNANDQMQDQALAALVRVAMDDHFSEHPGTPKAKFTQVNAWLNQKLLTLEIARDAVTQITIDMLEDDPAFMKADTTFKKNRLDQMEKSKQLDFFTVLNVKGYFKLGQ